MAYDYGVMRENYLYQYLSDWCGDDAVILHVHDEIRKFNYMGDTQTVTGEVLAKRIENGQNLVDVAVKFVNQRGEESVRATATIALPSKDNPRPKIIAQPSPISRLVTEAWRVGARVGLDPTLILAIMVLPFVTSISRDVFDAVPPGGYGFPMDDRAGSASSKERSAEAVVKVAPRATPANHKGKARCG